MVNAAMPFSNELMNQIRRIEIRTRHKVEDLFAGSYLSVFKGRGIEFDEVRPYEAGDDVRSIDWNVTARMGELYVKRFIEDLPQLLYWIDICHVGFYWDCKVQTDCGMSTVTFCLESRTHGEQSYHEANIIAQHLNSYLDTM